MREVKWLQQLLYKFANGANNVSAKQSNFELERDGDNPYIIRAYHFRTLILELDLLNRKVLSIGGAYSQTDSRYINNILYFFNMANRYKARIKNYVLEVVNLEGEVVVK